MKNIDKIIYHKVIECVVFLAIIVVAYFAWSSLPKEMLEIARIYDTTSLAYVTVDGYQDYKFYPMSDEASKNFLQPMLVTLRNETNILYPYHIVFRISKDSTLNDEYLKYSIGDEVYSLKDRFYQEDQLYRYYLIDDGDIIASNKTYYMRLWLDESTPEEEIGKTLKYSLINLDNIILA
ncbi:MAG: hypothetical protein IJ772_00545 [Bacilli bacterium]|nr:hypothetical protein [Bacilli bacterium]